MAHRPLFYLLPAATIVAVGVALLVVARERPVLAARLYGGPTVGVQRHVFRLEVVRRFARIEQPASDGRLRVRVEPPDGKPVERTVSVRTGTAVRIELAAPASGALRVELASAEDAGSELLARGSVRLTQSDWASRAGRRGGWLPGEMVGRLRVRVAPLRGALAVPFEDELVIQVDSGGRPVRGAVLEASFEGVERLEESPLVTDDRGRVAVPVAVLGHAASVRAKARHGTLAGRFSGVLPVVPGAMRADLRDQGLRIRSPIERDVAFVSVVTESRVVAGGAVQLRPDGRGGAEGTMKVDVPGGEPLWAVVSSEADMRSMALVGWPLRPQVGGEPRRTFDVPDALLLDGVPAAERRERNRQQRARALAALFALGAMALAALIVWRDARQSRLRIERHFGEQLGDEAAEASRIGGGSRATWAVLVALACVVLGFAALALLAMVRK